MLTIEMTADEVVKVELLELGPTATGVATSVGATAAEVGTVVRAMAAEAGATVGPTAVGAGIAAGNPGCWGWDSSLQGRYGNQCRAWEVSA